MHPATAGNRPTAAAVSVSPVWVYRSIVRVMVLCRASVWAAFGDTPDRANVLMKVCRRQWKSAYWPPAFR